MTKTIREPAYLAYLLRLWQDGESQPWRATLKNPHTGEQHSFPNLDTLLAFLRKKTDRNTPPADE